MNERPYTPTDLSQVIEIFRAAIHSLAVPYYNTEQLAAWASFSQNVAGWQQRLASLRTIVAEQDGVLAGFASYEHNGHLDFLYTHPSFARRGIATRLYLLVESALRAVAVPCVFTEASLAARPFFERHGFQIDAEELVERQGVQLRRFAMHKQISNACSERK